MSIVKAIIRILIVGIFRWPAFAATRIFSMDDSLHKLLVLLINAEKYVVIQKMLKRLQTNDIKSEMGSLTKTERNLLLEAQVWEYRLRQVFDAKSVTMLAGIYEKQCLESKAYELLNLSVRLDPCDFAILSYFSSFCQRSGHWEDAYQALLLQLEKNPTDNIVKRNLIEVKQQLRKSEKGGETTKPTKDGIAALGGACEELSKFFDSQPFQSVSTSSGYPHIVSLTHSDITNDNRVKKIAACVSMRGFRSTLIGPSSSGRVERGFVGGADVILIPVQNKLRQLVRSSIRGNTYRYIKINMLKNHLLINEQVLRIRKGDKYEAKVLASQEKTPHISVYFLKVKIFWISSRIKWLETCAEIKSIFGGILIRRQEDRHNHFRSDHLDFEIAFGPVIEQLKPDLIHINDYHLVGVGVTAARNLKKKGINTRVIYDAHELVIGIEHQFSPIWKSEVAHFIGSVDGVICVSEFQAEIMTERYQLGTKPTIVSNAPITTGSRETGATIRDDLNIQGKILTYHGGATAIRGLETIVRSLEYLPEDVHLALMVSGREDFLKSLIDIEAEIRDARRIDHSRLHFLPYVAPERLSHYLSTSDLTIIGLLPISSEKFGNHHIAMPNKLFESIQAKVPIVTSDMPALSSFVLENRVGTVYEAGSGTDLATKIVDLFNNPIDKKNIFTEELLYRCSWEHQVEKLFILYEQVLNELQCPQENIGSLELEFRVNTG